MADEIGTEIGVPGGRVRSFVARTAQRESEPAGLNESRTAVFGEAEGV